MWFIDQARRLKASYGEDSVTAEENAENAGTRVGVSAYQRVGVWAENDER